MAFHVSARSITVEAAIDLSSFQYHFGYWTGGQITSGTTALTAQGPVAGIIGEAVAAQGRSFGLIVPDCGIAMIKLSGTIAQDAVVATAADGRAVAFGTTAADQAWGVLLEGGVAGDIVAMQFMFFDSYAG